MLACSVIGVSKKTMYLKRKENPELAERWDEALQLAVGKLEEEARRRAFEGCERPVYQGGALVGVVVEYSDRLMIRMLEAHHPAYKQKHEISGADGRPLLEGAVVQVSTESARLDEVTEILGEVATLH